MQRILLIDDDEAVRATFCAFLERAGYEVVTASNGVEGLDLYRKDPTPLVITDIVMPEKEGTETIMELRRDFPDVKIIAVSGGGRIAPQSYLEMAGQLGANRMLPKPVPRDTLVEVVRDLLDEKAAEEIDQGGD
jgi:CheY-like chemotaxis protein